MKIMKSGLVLLLAVLMIVSFVSCNDGGTNIETTGSSTTETPGTTDAPATTNTPSTTTPPQTTGDPTPPETSSGFKAGFGRTDVTPTSFPIMLSDGTDAIAANEKIYSSCVALSDGEKTVLLVTVDIINTNEQLMDWLLFDIPRKLNVEQENIFISATHNHSAPKMKNTAYLNLLRKQIVESARLAIEDLKPTEAYSGKAYTEELAFVRRYLRQDGTYHSILDVNPTGSPLKEHESEADNEMQLIRFVREDAKDIVMVNWQAHPAHGINERPGVIQADFVGKFRTGMEAQGDIAFAYYTGACGNINLQSVIKGIPGDTRRVANELVDLCKETLPKLEKAELGTIKSGIKTMSTPFDVERMNRAKEVMDTVDETEKKKLAKEYGFVSPLEAEKMYGEISTWIQVYQYTEGMDYDINLGAITFGDFSFVAAPYEMFDTNGMQIKEASPTKITFVCAPTNGGLGYIPSDFAYPHGQYEVYKCPFVKTGDRLANGAIELLKSIYDAK